MEWPCCSITASEPRRWSAGELTAALAPDDAAGMIRRQSHRAAWAIAAVAALLAPAVAHADLPPSAASLRAEVAALLKRWADAQHRGDAAAYLALYDKAHFKGEK